MTTASSSSLAMKTFTTRAGTLQVAGLLVRFVEDELLPGTGISAQHL